MHRIALHGALHYVALHCIALSRIALHCMVHCIANALRRIALHCIVSDCSAIWADTDIAYAS